MDKHKPSDEIIKDLDNILSKLNAMEIVASDEFQKNSIKIQRALVEGQMHSVNEFQHLKKAIDLLTLQLFDVQNKMHDTFQLEIVFQIKINYLLLTKKTKLYRYSLPKKKYVCKILKQNFYQKKLLPEFPYTKKY